MPAHLVVGCGARAVSRKTPIYFILFTPSQKHLKLKFAHLQKVDRDEDNDPEKYFAAKFFEKKPERPSTDKLV